MNNHLTIQRLGPWFALPFRLAAFALVQAAIALFVGWDASSAWWPIVAVVVNLLTIILLGKLMGSEGESFWSFFAFRRDQMKGDLLWLLPVLALALPLAYVPNVGFAALLFGDPEAALTLFVRPLPLWAALAALAFPLTIMFAELPLYFGYVMRRLEQQTGNAWLAWGMPTVFLAAQHVTLPLIFDWRFAVWRLLMFLPFAAFVGLAVRLRPSLLAYMVLVQGLLDLAMVIMLIQLSS